MPHAPGTSESKTAPRAAGLRDWLALGRVSNLPTVWSNCMVGTALAAQAPESIGSVRAVGLSAAVVSASLLYLAGMVLNDWFDRDIDAVERPARPIPAGTIGRRQAGFVGLGLLLLGVLAAGVAGQNALLAAVLLSAMIVAYDGLHRKSAVFVVLLGACRGAVYVLAWASQDSERWNSLSNGYVAALAFYVILVSLIARQEAAPAKGKSVIRRVQFLLAGICLLDAVFVIVLGFPGLSVACIALFVVTILGHRRVAGS